MKSRIPGWVIGALVGALALPTQGATNEAEAIRVVVVGGGGKDAATPRLKDLGFLVSQVRLEQLQWNDLAGQVVLLPSCWAENQGQYQAFQQAAPQFHDFVKQGGGLVVCQPNPHRHPEESCTPALLPYPMTFYNWYDEKDTQRVNATHAHYITEDLQAKDLPFPADKVVKWDKQYKILALGARSESPSLLVCTFAKGRVVVQTGNELRRSISAFPDEVFRRMIIWAAGREPARFRGDEKGSNRTERIGTTGAPSPP